jgi:WD40 repeat protein
MVKMNTDQPDVSIGTMQNISGEVTIAGGDIYKGFTAEQVSALLTQITSTFQPSKFDGRCPYKGLDAFEEEDADLFFGRENLVEDLILRVKETRTVFVAGPSGSGKSSLMRAGLVHALRQGAIKELHSEYWIYAVVQPGRAPLEALALALSRLKSPDLGNYFRQHSDQPQVLHECAESILSDRKDQRFVLYIDQFEEIFTQISNEAERVSFLNTLTHAATQEGGRTIILFTMRSDFVSNCATYPQVNAMINQQFVQVGAMQLDELVSAIAQPALRVGLRIDPDLITQIINDMKGEPGALPLMQFALKDLFDAEQAKGGVISLSLKDYFQRGGIQKSLERHADMAFAKLEIHEQELARSIFSGLIEIGRGTQDTRRTALFNEIIPAGEKASEIETIVQKLANARLITTNEQAGMDTVTISHEKLIDAWPWLKKLVNENRETIAVQNEIAADAREWADHSRDKSYLYQGARLANASEMLSSRKLTLSQLAQEFVQAGRTRQRRGQFALISWVTMIIVVLIAAVIVFSTQSSANRQLAVQNADIASTAQASADEAQKQANIALARLLAAQAQSVNTTRNSNQMLGALLAVQAMKLFPSSEAAQVLLNNNLAAPPINRMSFDDAVNCVGFSSDGKYAVAGSSDGTVRVWETMTGNEVSRMRHDQAVWSVVFSRDGKYVVSGSSDNSVRVWEAATGKEVARMVHDGSVNVVAISRDGKYVASGSNDKTARIWDTLTGREIARMEHDDSVRTIAFSPDGKYLASGSEDTTARVWEAATGLEISRIKLDDWVYSVDFSPDGKYVLSSGGFEAEYTRVWEALTGQEVARMPQSTWVKAAFSRDGKYVVTGGFDGTVHVWETSTGKEIASMTHDDMIYSVAFSPDGMYVISGSNDNTARVWEVRSGKEVARMTHDGPVQSVAFSDDGKFAISGSSDGTARVWEPSTGKSIQRIPSESFVRAIVFSQDGKYMASGSWDGNIRIWDVATSDLVAHMSQEGRVNALAFDPNHDYLVSGAGDNAARVWEISTGREISHMTHDSEVLFLAFSPDGKYVASGSFDNTVRVWEAMTGREVARMTHDPVDYDKITAVAFSPNGKYVLSAATDGTARVWEALTGVEVARMTHESGVSAAVFSPDGNYVASSGGDTVQVWESMTGKKVAQFKHDFYVEVICFSPDGKYIASSANTTTTVWELSTGKVIAQMEHDDVVHSIAFSPDGKRVVTGSADKTARLWDAFTGKEIAQVLHDGMVWIVGFSPDNKYVVSGSDDGTTRMWVWRPEDLIQDACSRLPRNLTSTEWAQFFDDIPYQPICTNLLFEPESTPTP